MKTNSHTPTVKPVAPASTEPKVTPEPAKEISAMLLAGRSPETIQLHDPNAIHRFDALLALTLFFAVMERGRRADVKYRFPGMDWYVGACKIGDRSAATFEAIIALLRETVQTDVHAPAAYRRFLLKIADECSEIENLRHDLKQNPNRPSKKAYSNKLHRLQSLVGRTQLKCGKYANAVLDLSIEALQKQISAKKKLARQKSITIS